VGRIGAERAVSGELAQKFFDRAHHLQKIFEPGGLDEVPHGTQSARALDIHRLIRATKDNHGESSENGMVAEPFEHFETIHAGHFQIQQKKSWEWIGKTVLERGITAQIVKDLFAVVNKI